jgi:hypothetical protein
MVNNAPSCHRCTGKNWIDLGESIPAIDPLVEGMKAFGAAKFLRAEQRIHLWQCGGGYAHDDPENMKNGCGRIIRATPEEMTKGGLI